MILRRNILYLQLAKVMREIFENPMLQGTMTIHSYSFVVKSSFPSSFIESIIEIYRPFRDRKVFQIKLLQR